MKFKLILVFSLLIGLSCELRAEEPAPITEQSQELIKILGEEFIARYGSEMKTYIDQKQDALAKQLLQDIKQELDAMDCFEVSDFFGNPDNSDERYRELDMDLWHQMTISCPNIMKNLEPYGGLKEQVASYFYVKLSYQF